MSDHLPECPAASPVIKGFWSCRCDMLRACEQRVVKEVATRKPVPFGGLWLQQHEIDFIIRSSRDEGVQAAREAVDALDSQIQNVDWCEGVNDALAAIDALKGDTR